MLRYKRPWCVHTCPNTNLNPTLPVLDNRRKLTNTNTNLNLYPNLNPEVYLNEPLPYPLCVWRSRQIDDIGDEVEEDDIVELWRRFRPSTIRAFNDAKDAGGANSELSDDYVTKREFRLLLRYVALYATMFEVCGLILISFHTLWYLHSPVGTH